MTHTPCPLCLPLAPDRLIWRSEQLSVVWGTETDYPCLVQVIWQAHVKEMCDLSAADKVALMEVVFAIEATMHLLLKPSKMNVASLGNWVPHLHWHVIPRFENDAQWPNAIWAAKAREGVRHGLELKTALAQAIVDALDMQVQNK